MTAVLELLAAQPILLVFGLVGAGAALGHVKVRGVGLGAAAVLFLALGVGALGAANDVDLHVPEAFGVLGLTLFTFTVGIVSGASFFASLRRSLGLVAAMVGVLGLGALVAVGVGRLLALDPATVAGGFAGAVTNTPALAAAREAAGDADAPTVAYAVTYVFGVIGMLVVAHLVLRRRADDDDTPPALVNRTVRVEVRDEPSLRELLDRHDGRITFSRLRRGEDQPIEAAAQDDVLREGDMVTVVGEEDAVEAVTTELGHASTHLLQADRRYLDMRRITVSNPAAAGLTIGEIELTRRFGATISRLRRGDIDVVASDELRIQPGDRVRVIAPRDAMPAISRFFGDSSRGFSDINPAMLGLGMAAGVLLGLVAVPLAGGSFTVGAAMGTLVVGLVLGWIGRVGRVVTVMPFTAAQAISELGLLLFLAQAGTAAGGRISGAFADGQWWRVVLLGIAVTATVGLLLWFVMRRVFRTGGTTLSGIVAGAQTQPAVLAFANGRTGFDPRVALGYALVYPAAMIAKIVLGQVLGSLAG